MEQYAQDVKQDMKENGKEEKIAMMTKNHSRGSLPYFFSDILYDNGCPFKKIERETNSGKKFVYYMLGRNPRGNAIVSMNNSIQRLEQIIMGKSTIPEGQLKKNVGRKILSIMGKLDTNPDVRPGHCGSTSILYSSDKPNYTEKIIFPTYK